MRYGYRKNQKPLVRYRFKDSMGCVFFRTFKTDREARVWHENNRVEYQLREFERMGFTFKSKILDCLDDF